MEDSLFRGFVISSVRYYEGPLYRWFHVTSRVREIEGPLYRGFVKSRSVISRVRYNEIGEKKTTKCSLCRDIVHYYFVTVLHCTILNTVHSYGTGKLFRTKNTTG